MIRPEVKHYAHVEDDHFRLIMSLKIVLREGRRSDLGDQVVEAIKGGDMELLCAVLSHKLNTKQYEGRENYLFREFGNSSKSEYGWWEEISLKQLCVEFEEDIMENEDDGDYVLPEIYTWIIE